MQVLASIIQLIMNIRPRAKILHALIVVVVASLLSTNCAATSRANKNAYVREFSVGAGLIVAEKISNGIFPFLQKCPRNIICMDGGRRKPAPGYSWVDKTDPNNLAVKWMAGLTHPQYAHVMASNEENTWIPETGFTWSTGASDGSRFENENLEVNIEKRTGTSLSDSKSIDSMPNSGAGYVDAQPTTIPNFSAALPTHRKAEDLTDTQPSARYGVLTAQDPNTQIDVRDGPDEQAFNRHYGLAGNRVNILEVTTDNSGHVWYKVFFPSSKASGWIRDNFINLTD